MRSPGHRLAALALGLLGSGAVGCTGDEFGAGQSHEPELETLRLGRVHVVLEPESDPAEDPYDDLDAVEVTARFAFVRGFEEDFVRARIDMPVLPADVVTPAECVASDSLTTVSAAEASDVPARGELLLVDAGDLRIRIGDTFEEPLQLIKQPDLLPYMTGFKYSYYSEELPELLDDGRTAVVVDSRAALSEDLPEFRAEGTVPPVLALHVTEDDLQQLSRDDALVLRWQAEAEADDDIVTVRLTGLQGGEPTGSELTCVLYDQGQARLSFDRLRPLGLSLDSGALRVTVSRMHATSFDAGDFVGSELLVERRETLVLPLR